MTDRIAGFTSTGSKRPETLFGSPDPTLPSRMTRSAGCQVWDENGREYIDYIMGLGSVALGYGHPSIIRAAAVAMTDGVVGPLAPVLEEEVAATVLLGNGQDDDFELGIHGRNSFFSGCPLIIPQPASRSPRDSPWSLPAQSLVRATSGVRRYSH